MATALGKASSSYTHYENVGRFKSAYLPADIAQQIAEVLGKHGVDEREVLALAGVLLHDSKPIQGFNDGEAVQFQMSKDAARNDAGLAAADHVARALAPHIRALQIFTLTRSFGSLGLLAGDQLAVELQHDPRPGDIVLVNFDEHGTGNPITLVRRYFPPFLASTDASDPHPALQIDGHRVGIMATVEASWRTTASK
jgi:hypothetical protein